MKSFSWRTGPNVRNLLEDRNISGINSLVFWESRSGEKRMLIDKAWLQYQLVLYLLSSDFLNFEFLGVDWREF